MNSLDEKIEQAWDEYWFNSSHSESSKEIFFRIVKSLIQSLPRYDWDEGPEWAEIVRTQWFAGDGSGMKTYTHQETRPAKPTPPKYSAIEYLRNNEGDMEFGAHSCRVLRNALLELAEMIEKRGGKEE